MKKKFSLCVIGNSHAGAIWEAWKSGAIAASAGFSMTVFASQATSVVELARRDGALVPMNSIAREMFAYTSGGKTSIVIGEYDAFLLAGLGFGIDLARMFSRCKVVEHLAQGPAEMVVSHACLVEMIKAHNAKSAALKFAKEIRADSSKPILIYPTPFLPESAVKDWKDPSQTERALRENIVPRSMAASAELAGEYGCEVFWQHPATMSLPGLTKAMFAKGAVNLRASLDNQGRHVNPDFALLSLRAILQRLDQLAPGRVLDRAREKRVSA